jgi:hypothetical protein
MNRTWKLATLVATIAAVFAAASTVVQAQDLQYSALLSRIQALEAQVETQQMDFASYSMGGEKNAYGMGVESVCDCQSPQWYFGYELTALRPYVSSAGTGGNDDDYGVGHRLSLGYEGAGGLGVRARYWLYNHGVQAAFVQLHVDMDVLDLEVTLHERMRKWDLLASGGFRYGRASIGPAGGRYTYEGTGGTIALEAMRAIGQSNLYLVGNVRTAALLGEIDRFGFGELDDEVMLMVENQLGVGWRPEWGRLDLNFRAVWETQVWYNAAMGDDVKGLTSALGFSGPTFLAEIRY